MYQLNYFPSNGNAAPHMLLEEGRTSGIDFGPIDYIPRHSVRPV
jgi:hypothetical protein